MYKAFFFTCAGYPMATSRDSACVGRNITVNCIVPTNFTGHTEWSVNGGRVNDSKQLAINSTANTLTVVNTPNYADRNTSFQCCIQKSQRLWICGQCYLFAPRSKLHTLLPFAVVAIKLFIYGTSHK